MEEQKQITKNMLERLIIVHNAIKSGIYPDKEQLRTIYKEKVGCNEKPGIATISRDIELLRTRFNAPLEWDRFEKGYYYADDNWKFNLNNISTEEIFYLSTVKNLLQSFKNSPIYEEISNVIDFITDTQMGIKSNVLNRICIPPSPIIITNERYWKVILASLEENLIIEFDYNGRWNKATTHRRVHPYQVLLDQGRFFLFGYSEERKAERLFYFNRMMNVKLTPTTFELPEDIDFNIRTKGGKFGAFSDNKAEKYQIVFYREARQILKDSLWADDQVITDYDDLDCTKIEFTSAQGPKVLEWVLAQGKNAKPLAPESFVEEWRQNLIGALANLN